MVRKLVALVVGLALLAGATTLYVTETWNTGVITLGGVATVLLAYVFLTGGRR